MARVKPTVYRHDQMTPALEWTIAHNLSGGGATIPAVDVFIQDGGQTMKMIPAGIEIMDANTVKLTFSQPRFGFAIVLM